MIEQTVQHIYDMLPSFYSDYFADKPVLDTLYSVVALSARQSDKKMSDLLDMLDIHKIPVFAREYVVPLEIRSVDVQELGGITYATDATYYGSGAVYGDGPSTLYAIKLPRRNIVNCAAVSNTLFKPGVLLLNNKFFLKNDTLYLQEDPFTLFADTVVSAENEEYRSLALFLFNVDVDAQYIFKQAGVYLGGPVPSSEAYRAFVAAAYRAMREGLSIERLEDVAYALVGGGKTLEDEVVEDVGVEYGVPVVVTDKNVYRVE